MKWLKISLLFCKVAFKKSSYFYIHFIVSLSYKFDRIALTRVILTTKEPLKAITGSS